MKKLSVHSITGVIHSISGLRVGGSDELLETGAADLTCIKNPVTLQPYLPGSSIKGKLRSEMESRLGKVGSEPCGCGKPDCLVCRIFGPHKLTNHTLGPSRLIVRDAQPSPGQTIILEIKTESMNNRQTGTAEHPRKMERVPAGTRFDFRMKLHYWDMDQGCKHDGKTGKDALIAFLQDALRHVQDSGIGSGISRGSGEVQFRELETDGVPFSLA